MKSKKVSVLGIVVGVLSFGCGESDDSSGSGGQGGQDPAAEACKVVADQGTSVAAAKARDQAPALVHQGDPYTVDLVSGAAGYVKIPGGEDSLIFVKSKGVVSGLFQGLNGTTDLLVAPTPNEDCPQAIPQHWDLELAGKTGDYYLKLGPAAISQFWLVFTEAASHGHDP